MFCVVMVLNILYYSTTFVKHDNEKSSYLESGPITLTRVLSVMEEG